MDKENFIAVLKEFKKECGITLRKSERVTGKQLQNRTLLNQIENLSTKWFEHLEPLLRSSFNLDEDVILIYREQFGKLLELSGGKPSKRVVQTIFDAILRSFHINLLVPVQKYQGILSKFPNLDTILNHTTGLENDYLTEAIDCARLGKRRAAIILGWCAAINRLHLYIQKEGFTRFNQASLQMSAIQTGRYKRFNKKFEVHNLSELQMSIFDGDLLWILEFLGVIDGNQHERLGICFTLRNTCAHPGDTTVSDENALSFFSDVDTLIFSNKQFSVETNHDDVDSRAG
ncbi:MAG: hypothetical protein HY787_10220 [Deltaproteobacteria bacterium]|nr:hypothetical protein [Deltaproteobacteria bacterium]